MSRPFFERTSKELRSAPLRHTIDVGFVNRRAIDAVIGQPAINAIDRTIAGLPPLPEALREIRIDRIYTRMMLEFCEVHGIKSLREVLTESKGHLFCSTETIEPIKAVWDAERVSGFVRVPGRKRHEVRLDFTASRVWSSTLKSELHEGASHVSLIARFYGRDGNVLVFHPLVIGMPWLASEDSRWPEHITMWWRGNFYEHPLSDFDEFSRVAAVPEPKSFDPMQDISERAFKSCVAELLGDAPSKDWGGETSDHFTAHLHLGGRQLTAAFLFKGPARFSPMKLTHLGKNGDQIYRLSKEPAEVLFIQHCHEITPVVREVLRALAVQPSRPRRYCLIDGRDSLRLLEAYDLLEKARELTNNERTSRARRAG